MIRWSWFWPFGGTESTGLASFSVFLMVIKNMGYTSYPDIISKHHIVAIYPHYTHYNNLMNLPWCRIRIGFVGFQTYNDTRWLLRPPSSKLYGCILQLTKFCASTSLLFGALTCKDWVGVWGWDGGNSGSMHCFSWNLCTVWRWKGGLEGLERFGLVR